MGTQFASAGYRLVLMPLEPPAVGNKLCLVPASRVKDGRLLPIPPFDKLLERFRAGHIAYSGKAYTWILNAYGEKPRHYGYEMLGSARDISPENSGEYRFEVVDHQLNQPWFLEFKELAEIAGASLPLALCDALAKHAPTTAFAWWMTVLWTNGPPVPSGTAIQHYFTESAARLLGPVCDNPFQLSMWAIERCPHLSPPATAIISGNLSLPWTKPEIARRIANKRSLTRTEVAKVLRGLRLEPAPSEEGDRKSRRWFVILDGLPDDVRARLVNP